MSVLRAVTTEQPTDRRDGSKPRILFVEDDDALRNHLAQVLSDDYAVDAAADGEQALLAVLAAKPDLVVADVVMPGLDGVELVTLVLSSVGPKSMLGLPSTVEVR
jgi:DNA-binding response OmpR family regulator